MTNQDQTITRSRYLRRRNWIQAGVIAGLAILTASSALITKTALRHSALEPLTAVSATPLNSVQSGANDSSSDRATVHNVAFSESDPLLPFGTNLPVGIAAPADQTAADAAELQAQPEIAADPSTYSDDPSVRWFNGRPVRPARTMTMIVTAYSPDARSCGPDAHGITSSVHNVYTNGMKLVAADTRLLPLGSMISVPGYDDGNIVPVLDRGGAIKGHRLDLLYPTHEVAREWGVKKLKITVWEYADGRPADDIRKIRDSK